MTICCGTPGDVVSIPPSPQVIERATAITVARLESLSALENSEAIDRAIKNLIELLCQEKKLPNKGKIFSLLEKEQKIYDPKQKKELFSFVPREYHHLLNQVIRYAPASGGVL